MLLKIDQEILDQAIKEGMPSEPKKDNYSSEAKFEEALTYWMSNYGIVLVMRQKLKDTTF